MRFSSRRRKTFPLRPPRPGRGRIRPTFSRIPPARTLPRSHFSRNADGAAVDPNRILIIDYGSQFTQLIARR
ncbi:MAG: hypothetical protein KY467_18045, partial [Gemmatimonadetes bacterium]|nr:hypothetical protein [Gemmatimonadota bacterium]